MADTLLKVDNINVYYGNIHAVKDISFEVDQGEIVTLIGANGAGKSTMLEYDCFLRTACSMIFWGWATSTPCGDILYKGSSIKGMRAHKIVEAGLAHVPEGRHVFLHMTVEENLDMGAYTQPASTIAPNKEKVFELFPRLKERRKLRIRPSGSAGGHNGLKSIIARLGGENFPRIRIGVGAKPRPDYDLADWVLGKFPPEDAKATA